MPKNLPSLKAKQLIRLLKSGGCKFYREGKGDHKLCNHGYRLLDGAHRWSAYKTTGVTETEAVDSHEWHEWGTN